MEKCINSYYKESFDKLGIKELMILSICILIICNINRYNIDWLNNEYYSITDSLKKVITLDKEGFNIFSKCLFR